MHLDPWIWYISVCVSCESFVFGGQKAAYDFMFFLNGEHTHLGWSSLWTSRVIRPVSTWCLMLIVFVARAMDLILLKSNLSLLCLPYEIPVLIVHPCLQPFALYIVPSHIRVRSKKWIHFKTNNTRHVWHTQRTKTHTHTTQNKETPRKIWLCSNASCELSMESAVFTRTWRLKRSASGQGFLGGDGVGVMSCYTRPVVLKNGCCF